MQPPADDTLVSDWPEKIEAIRLACAPQFGQTISLCVELVIFSVIFSQL